MTLSTRATRALNTPGIMAPKRTSPVMPGRTAPNSSTGAITSTLSGSICAILRIFSLPTRSPGARKRSTTTPLIGLLIVRCARTSCCCLRSSPAIRVCVSSSSFSFAEISCLLNSSSLRSTLRLPNASWAALRLTDAASTPECSRATTSPLDTMEPRSTTTSASVPSTGLPTLVTKCGSTRHSISSARLLPALPLCAVTARGRT